MVPVNKPKAACEITDSAYDLCKWINENIVSQSQIIAITDSNGRYTIFYYK